MLLKTKATGRSSLHSDDRFYLEVRFGGLGDGGGGSSALVVEEPIVDYIFVSRLWTAGRTLDEIVSKHKAALEHAYGKEYSGKYSLLCERTGVMLPLRVVLQELGDSGTLMNCDVVIVVPYEPPPPVMEPDDPLRPTDLVPSPPPPLPPFLSVAHQESPPIPPPNDQISVPEESSKVGISGSGDGGGVITIVVQHGKEALRIPFSREEWASLTIMDLKIRLEGPSKVPRAKQKLLYKGVLNDGQALASSKLKDGIKVLLMGGGK